MGSFYRPKLPTAVEGQSNVIFEQGTPGFNAYYKWAQEKNGVGPYVLRHKIVAPSDWEPPADWTYSSQTGFWYSPKEMTNAGYLQEDGQWIHKNEIKKREIERQNAELDARIAKRKATEGRLRSVFSKGRNQTILTSANGVNGSAEVLKKNLSEVKGIMK